MSKRPRSFQSVAVAWSVIGFIGCSGDGAARPSDTQPVEPDPVTAGECFGQGIRCETPEIVRFEPGELRSCAELEGEEVHVLWTNDVSEIDCFAGRCSIALDGVALGPDGSVWASARVYGPGIIAPQANSEPIADALLIYDSKGTPIATRLEPRTRLGHTTGAPPSLVTIDPSGRALRLVTANGANGVDLVSYDSAGARLTKSRLVEGASFADGFAVSPSVIVAVHRTAKLEDAVEPPPLWVNHSGIAMFDRSLNAIWHQSALPPGRLVSSAIAPPDPSGGLSILMDGPLVPGRDSLWRLVHLDANGVLQWVREFQSSTPEAVSLPDGGAIVLAWKSEFRQMQPSGALHRIGADGIGVWQHELSASVLAGRDVLVGVDRARRVVLAKNVDPTALRFISEDGRTCVSYRIPAESCVTIGAEQFCSQAAIEFGDRVVAFAVATHVGVARLGGLP